MRTAHVVAFEPVLPSVRAVELRRPVKSVPSRATELTNATTPDIAAANGANVAVTVMPRTALGGVGYEAANCHERCCDRVANRLDDVGD